MRCTVHGAPTSKGPIKQLKSSLRSRRKLRLGGPGNGQKSVRARSLGRLSGRNGRVSRLHFPKIGRSRGSRHAPEFPGTRAHYSRRGRYCKNENPLPRSPLPGLDHARIHQLLRSWLHLLLLLVLDGSSNGKPAPPYDDAGPSVPELIRAAVSGATHPTPRPFRCSGS